MAVAFEAPGGNDAVKFIGCKCGCNTTGGLLVPSLTTGQLNDFTRIIERNIQSALGMVLRDGITGADDANEIARRERLGHR